MRQILLVLTFILILSSMWLALTLGQIDGPPANPDSPVRNILYTHVPSSICALLCFVVLLVSSIAYLCTNRQGWDLLAAASAEVGALFATVLNATGMIFSRAEWNIWWTPSPRLITSAILWFLYIVYIILRTNLPGSQQRRARICAVFGIIAFLDVPMVFISARFLPDIHRASFNLESSWQTVTLMLSMVATLLLASILIWLKTDIQKTQLKLEKESVY
ncbi:cytochrome c biogenesis protein CcsA [Planctomycetota bacterium]